MNFLHLTTFYPPHSFGGDATYIYRLAHALGDAGHHVDVIHCVDSYHLLHPAPPPVAYREHPNVTRHELRSGAKWLSPLLTQQTGLPLLKQRTIQRVLDSRAYDVVHYHNVSLLGPGILEMHSAKADPIKLYTTHEHWLICPTHVLWKYNRQACDRPQCFSCTIASRRPPQLWRHTDMLARAGAHVDRFVSPSRFTAQMHADRGFPYPVGHLPYFLDPIDSDWQRPQPRPQERPYFLFVGRLEVIKGVQTLIPIWDRIHDYDLLVVGDGTYADTLKAAAAGNPRIKFLGQRSQAELGALYVHAQACLVPSITYETFGIVIIEAFARRTPAIVRDLGALPEVIGDSGGGLVYRTDEELIEAIHRLGSGAERDRLGGAGYDAFRAMWSRDAHLAQYFDLISSAAATRSWPVRARTSEHQSLQGARAW